MRLRSIVPIISLGLLITACGSAGGPAQTAAPTPAREIEPTYPLVAGDWVGAITIEGQTIPGSLEVSQDGPDLQAVFRAGELGLLSRGSGTVEPDGTVQMTLAYDLQCPGTATMTGEMSPDGSRLTGSLVAADCTGDVSGSFRFSR